MRPSENEFSLIIADDHALFGMGIFQLLSKQFSNEKFSIAYNGSQAIEMVDDNPPELLLLDLMMPKVDGFQVMEHVLSKHPSVKIIVLSAHKKADYVKRCMDAGCHGYVTKESAFEELVLAIQVVRSGESYFGYKLASIALSERPLSARELETLQFLCLGKSNKMIAQQLEVSIRTVEAHRANIMSKLKIDNLPGLVIYAMQEGLINPP